MTFDGNRFCYQPISYLLKNNNNRVNSEDFIVPDKNASLLFSGGLDSSLFLAVNQNINNLYHINYHGEGSRLYYVAKHIANYFNKEIIEIDLDYNNFSFDEYYKCLSLGITGIQNPTQYLLQLSLKKKINNPQVEYLISGQNCDTMMYIDHYHAPTQLILHERINSTLLEIYRRYQIWMNTRDSDIDEAKINLCEHITTQNKYQIEFSHIFNNCFKEQYKDLVLPNVSNLSALKLIRWYRGSASVNDNFNTLKLQTGINRIAGLHHTEFIRSALYTKPSLWNLIFCKVEIADLFKKISGIDHRKLVTEAILKNSYTLSKTKKHRAINLSKIRKFNYDVTRELYEIRKKSIQDLMNRINHPALSNLLNSVKSKKTLTNEEISIIHRIANLDIYVRSIKNL
jgi:hypothetical protein